MANSVIANWDGHDYQARYFWILASGLRKRDKPFIVEVSYEAEGPKGFDDVIIRYNPGRIGRRKFAIEVEHHQIKFHVNRAGRFGYADLVEPDFIGAEKVSILERLKGAVAKAAPNATFTLVTTDHILDGDPLSELVNTSDHSLNIEKLRTGKTARSKMGKVRTLWREHLKLSTDEELFAIIDTFNIVEGHRSLDQMREDVDLHFNVAGLKGAGNTFEFKFDGTARALKAAGRSSFTREDFDKFCREQEWVSLDDDEDRRNVAIRSFGDGPTDHLLANPDSELSLLADFDARLLRPGKGWISDIQPEVEAFLKRVRQDKTKARLFLDAHASIAFLAGSHLGMKSGIDLELVQKGRGLTTVWRADDGKSGPPLEVETISIGEDTGVAIVVSLSRSALQDVREYLRVHPSGVGRVLHFRPAGGHGQASVAGGEHAAAMADQVADAVSELGLRGGARSHLFVAGPNAFTFHLGQHREALGKLVLYEFDFGGTRDYFPSFRIG